MTIMMKNPETENRYEVPKEPIFVTQEYRRLFGDFFSLKALRLSFQEMMAYNSSLSSSRIRFASLKDFENLGRFNMSGNAAYLGIVVRGRPEDIDNPRSLAYKLNCHKLTPTQEKPLFIPSYAVRPAEHIGDFDIIPEKVKDILAVPEFSIHNPAKEYGGAQIIKSSQPESLVGLKSGFPNILHTDWIIKDSALEVMITRA